MTSAELEGRRTGSVALSSLEVLILDCQATGPAPGGRLIEIGWARVPASGPFEVDSRLVALPEGERLPRRVAQITGLTDAMLAGGVSPGDAFGAIAAQAAPIVCEGRVPTVIHFAQFEAPFLVDLPCDVICAHAVARRLLPDLPRRTLRALAGYFGLAVGAPRRSREHVEATAFVWRSLVQILAEQESVRTWDELRAFLSRAPEKREKRRAYPMPREVRLAAPDEPGLYRMLRLDGSVLYVGKATSLKTRVNSYFRRQSGGAEKTLEMLSQARGLSFTVTESALEAALAEPDEIKRHRPQYNVALLEEGRSLWFATRDLREIAPRPDRRHTIGPLISYDGALGLSALADRIHAGQKADPARILGIPARFAPSVEAFELGIERFLAEHGEACAGGVSGLLALGARLWGEGWQEEEPEEDAAEGPMEPTPEMIARAIARIVVLGAHAIRRARWISGLVDSVVLFGEPGIRRALVFSRGEVIHRESVPVGAPVPVRPVEKRAFSERQSALTIASFDRLRVLTTELKRLTAEGHPAEIHFGARRVLSGERLLRALSWI